MMRRVGANRTIAEDVTQDCFVRVWETRRRNPRRRRARCTPAC
ncbi:MAG: hypothetical protein H8F28_19415 [Fibrella sp.]|nr:hypothetical protein [Armatimonadota bacterium]